MKSNRLFPVVLLTCCFSLLASFSFAQWELQYPLPTDQYLEDVCFVDDLSGWVVGKHGTIIHTNDGGVSWEFQESGTTLWLKSVTFTDPQTGWAVGRDYYSVPGNYIILHTSDGGDNWNEQLTGDGADLKSVFFIDSSKGWAVGTSSNGTVLHTDNGGIDWITQGLGSPYIDCNEVFFIDANNGWIAAESGLYITTNGGLEWVEQINMDRFLSVFFIDQNEGWASTWGFGYGYAYILHTTDSFSTWDTIVESYAGDLDARGFYSLYFKDPENGWMLSYYCYGGWFPGCSNSLKKTSDGGDTWESIYLPDQAGLNALYFTPDGKGCIVGDHGIIFNTTNWEDQWEQNSKGNNSAFYSISFADEMNGWAAGCKTYTPNWGFGQGSIMVHTYDGGASWEEQNTGVQASLRSVSFCDQKNGWAVGNLFSMSFLDTTYILHTANGGEVWQIQKWDTTYYLADICFIDESNGWTVGGYSDGYGYSEGKILRTIDGGSTWEQQFCDSCKSLNAIYFVDNDQGWVVGESIYKTTNGGQAWTEQVYDTSGFNLTSVFFVDEENGWIVGNKWLGPGILLHTSDGGNNWSYDLYNSSLYSIQFKDHLSGLISGGDGTVLLTEDGGATWEQQNSGTDKELYSVCFTSNGHGYAAGGWGTIIHSDDLIVSVEDLPTESVVKEIQCFPNPFSETTTLSYSLTQKSVVSIEIYNSRGQLVFKQKEGVKHEGQQEMIFGRQNLPTGIYFCVLKTNDPACAGQTTKIIKH